MALDDDCDSRTAASFDCQRASARGEGDRSHSSREEAVTRRDSDRPSSKKTNSSPMIAAAQ